MANELSASGYKVEARNTATASANKIHDNEVALLYGFSGGLVPGVTLYAYMSFPVVEAFGSEWLEAGAMSARFVHPVYDGDDLTIEATPSGKGLELKALNDVGIVCAAGAAWIRAEKPSIDIGEFPEAILPSQLPEASEEVFRRAGSLGAVEGTFSKDVGQAYAKLIEDDLPIWAEGFAHPGWLLQWANLAFTSNFRLGPWIHLSSEVTNFSSVREGDRVATRGRVASAFERKGHKFVELEVLVLARGAPALHVRHVAIWQPRRVS